MLASCQLFYKSYSSMFSYEAETGEESRILYFEGGALFSQFCINHKTNKIYASGNIVPVPLVFELDGRRIFDSNIFFDIISYNCKSMVLDERNSIIYSVGSNGIDVDRPGDVNHEKIIYGSNIYGLAIDTINEKLYYSNHGTNRIYKVNLEGKGNEEIVYLPSGLADPRGIALDVQRGKIYWANTGQKKIQRANLDGTDVENVVLGLGSPENLSLNVEENIIYITDIELGAIFSYSIDTGILDTLYTNDSSIPSSIEYNPNSGYLFWIDIAGNSGHRLDVTTKENVSVFVNTGEGISFAVDELQELIFVTSEDGLFKFNIDGSFGEKLNSIPFSAYKDVAIDILKEEVYFIQGNDLISITDYNGTPGTILYTSDDFGIIGNLQSDGLNNVLYWLEDGNIFQSDINDFSKELFFDYSDEISLFTLDYINSKIYFKSGDLVYSSNFDGSATEPIIGTAVNHMVADPATEKLFYSNNEGIFTSQLNGYYEEQYLSGFVSEFTFGSTDGYLVLPTIATEALANQNAITLSWEVSSDFNGFSQSSVVLGDFEIEKRNVFGQFENIGSVEYILGGNTYLFEDEEPFEGENEYRLKFISDMNGLTSYSKYFSTNFIITSAAELGELDKFHYRFQDQVFINNGTSGTMSIYSIDGQKVKKINFDATSNQIDVTELKAGIYVYTIDQEIEGHRKGRFIKM
ncbi:MAG: low density lipoprotein receptor-related protein 5/6 [Halioglobus sp.]|jgi:low density lipoprotein receptor-related protein 5/6